MVILAGGLAHEIAARRASQTWQTERLARLRQGYEELVDLFLHHHSESAQGGPVSAPVPAPPPVPAPTHAAPGRAGPGPVPRMARRSEDECGTSHGYKFECGQRVRSYLDNRSIGCGCGGPSCAQ